MAPLLDETVRLSNLSAIEDHPLPVWVDRIDRPGNVAVSQKYLERLGVATPGRTWEEHVLTPECSESYDEYRAAGQSDQHWNHELLWRRPDTGEILRLRSHAWWTDERTIQGEVLEAMPVLKGGSRWRVALNRWALFFLGFMAGWLAGGGPT